LNAVVTGFGRPVVFWGDLVVEDAVLVPGHGAVVDARWSADTRRGCASICDEFQSPNVT
jgi:hypothetical protein